MVWISAQRSRKSTWTLPHEHRTRVWSMPAGWMFSSYEGVMQRDAISQLSRTNRCNSSEIFMTVYSFSTSPIPMSWYFGFIDFFVHDVCVTRLSLKRNCLISLLSIISTRESVTYINQHVEHFILQSICDVEWNAIITFKLCCSRTWWAGVNRLL